jgi:hypothetical protein
VTLSHLEQIAEEMRRDDHPPLDVTLTDELIAWAAAQQPPYHVETYTVRI